MKKCFPAYAAFTVRKSRQVNMLAGDKKNGVKTKLDAHLNDKYR
jgi:hypothetical protein